MTFFHKVSRSKVLYPVLFLSKEPVQFRGNPPPLYTPRHRHCCEKRLVLFNLLKVNTTGAINSVLQHVVMFLETARGLQPAGPEHSLCCTRHQATTQTRRARTDRFSAIHKRIKMIKLGGGSEDEHSDLVSGTDSNCAIGNY